MVVSSVRPLLLPLLLVTACAAAPRAVPAAPPPSAASACVGSIDAAPDGAREVDDGMLLAEALGAAGQGRLCAGKVFEATRPVKVFRVWQLDRAYTETGR